MSADVYTVEEEVVIGSPLEVEIDLLPCDRLGCDASARVLLPGASLCRPCAEEFGLGGPLGTRYSVPLHELVGDERWREARRAEYEERVRRLPRMARCAERDRMLADQARRRVDVLLAEIES